VKFPFGLRLSLWASMVGLAMLVALVAIAVHAGLAVKSTVEMSATRASTLAQQAALLASDAANSAPVNPTAAIQGDRALAALFGSALAGDPTIFDLGVFDADGFALIHTDPAKVAFEVDRRPRISLLLEGNVLRQGLLLLGPARTFEERVPLEAAQHRFGEVRVGVSTTLMRHELLGSLKAGLWVAGAALLLAILMALAFAQFLSQRVRNVVAGLERFSEGEFGYRLAVEGQDELALLASSINALGERLESRARSGALDPTELLVATGQISTWAKVVSGLAHELADPLNAAALHLGQLKSKVRTPTPEAARHLKVLEDELKRLEQIVAGFRRFTVLGEMRAQWFDLRALLAEVAERFREDIGRGIPVRLEIENAPRRFWGDASLLRQAFANLMSNAQQAMPGGGSVSLSVEKREDGIGITVADEGIGIPEDIQSRIFDHSFTTKQGGSGIGLAVVQQVIKLHGGRIRLRSRPGEGTAVTLELPVRRTEPVTVG
jgi:signal transduction histidine kinase